MSGARAFAIDSRGCRRLDDRRATVELPHQWTTPAVFGGMAMACAVRAADLLTEPGSAAMHPLSASALFHAPLAPGPAQAEITELARTGRTLSVLTRLGGELTVTSVLTPASELGAPGALGAGPEGDALGPAPASGPAPEVPGPERLRPFPGQGAGALGASGMSRQVDWRALTPWMTRGEAGAVLGWLRPHRVPWTADGYLDPLWYMVAADLLGPCWFTGAPFRVATLSMEVQVLGLTRSPWLLLRATPDAAGRWAAGRVELWDRAGRLVASASQRAKLMAAGVEELPWSVTAFGWGQCRETAASDCSAGAQDSCVT